MDPDTLAEAIYSATRPAPRRTGPEPSTPSDKDVARFRGELVRFLEDLPGDLSVAEIREAFDNG